MANAELNPTLDSLLTIQDASLLHGLVERVNTTPATAGELTVTLTPWDKNKPKMTELNVFDLRRAAITRFLFPPPIDEVNGMEISEVDDEKEEFVTTYTPVLAHVAVKSSFGIDFIHPVEGPKRAMEIIFRYTSDTALLAEWKDEILIDPFTGSFDDGYYLHAQETLVQHTPFEKLLELADAA